MAEQTIVSPGLLKWNPSEYLYNPDFDLGIEDWLPKHPVAREIAGKTKCDTRSETEQSELRRYS